jgi:hypothetical protein
MLTACALQYERSWNKSLPYDEFYNNSYQESLKMAQFEMLYGHRYQTPLIRNEIGEEKVCWTQHITRSQETSSHGEREPTDCALKTEELR